MKKLNKFWPVLVLVLVFALACPPLQDIAEGKSKAKKHSSDPPCTNGDCSPDDPPCTNGDCSPDEPADKIGICHFPPGNQSNYHTIWINEKALESHLEHGDTIGACEEDIESELCEYTVEMCLPDDEYPEESETVDISLCDVPAAREAGALDGSCECYEQ